MRFAACAGIPSSRSQSRLGDVLLWCTCDLDSYPALVRTKSEPDIDWSLLLVGIIEMDMSDTP